MMPALIVFARRPRPGRVKTRLTALLTPAEAAGLYEAFLHDALRQYTGLDVTVRLYLAPSAEGAPSGIIPDGVEVYEQRGDDLGARMQHAFLETFAAGVDHAVVIGTDHPTLPSAFIERAFAALQEPLSVCLGPSDDGGYYLLGMNDFFPDLFSGMTYSHDAVFEQTLHRAAQADAHVTVLPPWYDVDRPGDLRRLVHDLDDDATTAPRTRVVLDRITASYPDLIR